jgi:hypothetical protein
MGAGDGDLECPGFDGSEVLVERGGGEVLGGAGVAGESDAGGDTER